MNRFAQKPSFLALALLVAIPSGCSTTDAAPKEENAAERRVLLRNLGEQVFLPSVAAFVTQSGALTKATSAYASSLTEEDKLAAQAAWKDAMAAWQRVEVYQVGPERNIGSGPGALGLRQEIYSFPDTNACSIDRALVEGLYEDESAFVEATYPNVRGLSAMEVVLFATSDDSACPANNSIITSGEWDALVAGDLEKRRAAYASTLSSIVQKQAKKLEAAWKDNFLEQLAEAGAASKLFDSTQDALNAVSDALFYLDTETKDMKLAHPLGISMVCTEKRCPDKVEHPWARVSKESILVNLEAFRDAYRGLPKGGKRGDAMWGFKDLLLSVSADDLATEMDTLIDEAIASVQAIEGSLEDALIEDGKQAAQADKAYMAIQKLSDRHKTDFIAKLSLKRPMSAAGDND